MRDSENRTFDTDDEGAGGSTGGGRDGGSAGGSTGGGYVELGVGNRRGGDSLAGRRRSATGLAGSRSQGAGRTQSAGHSQGAGGATRTPQSTGLKTRSKVLIAVGSVLVLALVAIAVWAALFVNRIDTKIALEPEMSIALNELLVRPAAKSDPYYLLFLGSDSRDPANELGRSDAIMLMRVDVQAPRITLISIPRDTEVTLPGHGNQKINAAYAYFGAAGTVRAVSELCGVDIAHFAEVDFSTLPELIDLIGGITVKVPVETYVEDMIIARGEQTFDGATALLFSRCRNYPTGDFQRVVNQRLVLQAIAKKVLAASPTELPGLIERFAGCVKTDLSATDALGLLNELRGFTADDMYTGTIPAHTNFHDGISYVAAEHPALEEMMERVNQGLPPNDPTTE